MAEKIARNGLMILFLEQCLGVRGEKRLKGKNGSL